MPSAIYRFLKEHRDFLGTVISSIVKPFGYLRLPTYSMAFRYAMCAARAGYWAPKVGKMGRNVRIDSGVVIRGNVKYLEIMDHSYLDTNVQLEIHGPIRIGRHVHITPNVYIQSKEEIFIGDYACIANGTKIYSASNRHWSDDGKENDFLLSCSSCASLELQYVEEAPVIIEEYAFVGINCVILPGVRIGRGAIVGAGSVVTRDIPPYMIAVGVPCKPVRQRVIPSELECEIER
ncbi:acyltransferase [Chloroflexota bacterium]